MAFNLKCADIGGEDCHFDAKGETKEEVIKKIYEHATEVHPEKLEGMTDEDKEKMNTMMNEKITEE